MLNGLNGKVVIVTGGSGGIGAATVRRLTAEGARVAIVDRDAAATSALAAELGTAALAITSDLAEDHAIPTCMATALRELGQIDFVVNNAAILTPPTSFTEQDDSYFDVQHRVNERAVFVGTREAMRHFRDHGQPGAIVNIAAVSGMAPFRGLASYSASKAAVIAMSRVAAAEGGPVGVRVNVVAPGFIVTPTSRRHFESLGPTVLADIEGTMPTGRGGRPEEVANAIAWLLSDEASYVSGAVIPVDGAFSACIA